MCPGVTAAVSYFLSYRYMYSGCLSGFPISYNVLSMVSYSGFLFPVAPSYGIRVSYFLSHCTCTRVSYFLSYCIGTRVWTNTLCEYACGEKLMSTRVNANHLT